MAIALETVESNLAEFSGVETKTNIDHNPRNVLVLSEINTRRKRHKGWEEKRWIQHGEKFLQIFVKEIPGHPTVFNRKDIDRSFPKP